MGSDNTFGEEYFNPTQPNKTTKKYFTKYLLVDGDITDPTMVMFKINGKWTEPCDFDSFIGDEIEDAKQGKLFLCSRDIDVGDRVKVYGDKNGTIKIIYPDNGYDRLNQTIKVTFDRNSDNDCEFDLNVQLKDIFKVIGEISPDAHWVKDGDEFDENQLQIKYHVTYDCLCKERDGYEDESCEHYQGGVNKYVDGCYRKKLLQTAYEIKVKGPCGHFH